MSAREAPAADKTTAARPTDRARFERDYLAMLVDHHLAAVEMAKACQTGGVRVELRDSARKMREEQLVEIARLREWLRQWHQVDKAPEMSAADWKMVEKLREKTGDPLEVEFLTMMIDHHGTAIEKSREAVDRVEHEEVREFSRTLAEKQSSEREELRRRLREWHGRG